MEYNTLKEQLKKKKTLFEDPIFKADDSSIGNLKIDDKIIWKRPKELVEAPSFIVEQVTRFDLVQGDYLADCWVISAAACISVDRPELLNRLIPHDQNFGDDYCGMFHFEFWDFGSWKKIIIDDKLPTIDNQLIFAKNKEQPNEFWVPLFEKAYAKLKGKYSDLDGGQTTYALVDFTGGITERISLAERRFLSGRLFDNMIDVCSRQSMMGCEIIGGDGSFQNNTLKNGLITMHAYAITKVVNVSLKSGRSIKLIRVRNPWGVGEWNGPWSDGSRYWDQVTDNVKESLQLMKKDSDGEFWMSFEDWISNFEYLSICHLDPEGLTNELPKHKEKTEWQVMSWTAEWIPGVNAGGSGIISFRQDLFYSNPQFLIELKTSNDRLQRYHLAISLMQMSNNWDQQFPISYDLYKIKDGVSLNPEGRIFYKNEIIFFKRAAQPINLREVTYSFELPSGRYLIIPYTLEANKAQSFLLRVYSEQEANVSSIAADKLPTTVIPVEPSPSSELVSSDSKYTEIFNTSTINKHNLDAKDLLLAMSTLFKKEGFAGFTSLEASRCLLNKYSKIESGFLVKSEFLTLCKDVVLWGTRFRLYDRDRSSSIDCDELDKVFTSMGLRVNKSVVETIVSNFGGRGKKLTLDDFILSVGKIVNIYESYKGLSGAGKLKMPIDEWISTAILF